MSTQITPPQGNGGSRESSEFEFVNVLNRSNLPGPPPLQQHSNPLLLSSNQAAAGPPGLLLSSHQPPLGPPAPATLTLATPTITRPPPAVSIQQPTPTPPVLSAQSTGLAVSVSDQTRVATVTAESPPTPGETRGQTESSSSRFYPQECSAG